MATVAISTVTAPRVAAMMRPMLRVAAKDLGRLRQIAGILTRHGYAHLAANLREGKINADDPRVRADTKQVGAPERLVQLLQDLGPTFIKLGQVLSTRPDLLPSQFQAELARLQDDVDPLPFADIEAQLVAAWGGPVTDFLAHIDEAPLATASIAQVHRARLEDGQEVVLKVQRPGLEPMVRADLDLLYLLARLLDATIEEMALYRPVEVVQAFEAAILDELDYAVEATNARAIADNFADDPRVHIPAIIGHLSGRTVMVMEYVEGVKITDLGPDRDLQVILDTALDIAFKMAFVHGVFHADPHPGNVMVTAEDRICLLDFGLVGRLTANMQRNLVQFAVAVASRDAETTARLIYRIGRPMERVALPELRDHVADLMGRYMVQRIDEIDAASLVNDLMDTAMAYRIRLPPAYALLAKAAVTVEGIARSLWPSLDITQAVLPYATKVLAERYNPQAVMKMALRSAVQVMDGVQEMPLLASQLVNDLQEGRMSVQITNDGLAELSASLRALGTKVFLGLVTAGCITGSFFVLAQYPWEYEGVNLWALLGLLLSGGLASAVLTWHIIGRRFGKLKLRTLFRLFRRR